ncbi:MAG: DUF47 family protein [Methanomicrobiaceae archaeon]|nr:DUF47 family protein [Methanomicrobiaceae archaeon]
MGVREWIVPQEKLFFDLFEKQAAVLVEASDHLVSMIEDYRDIKNKVHKMKQLEHRGDEITHSIYEHLNRTFITPLEPEEISSLASAMDDILDYIDGTAQQMLVYGIDETDDHMTEFSKLIALCVIEIQGAVHGIRDMKNPKYIEQRCIEINRLENLADDVLGHALKELFQSDDAITIIKLKDIYENLENATDKCEDAANVLGDIAIRHS